MPGGVLNDQRFRSLFDQMDEGFCVIEFIDGPHGPLSDYVHIAANAAYSRQAGIPNAVGQRVREIVPDTADSWVARFRDVLQSGRSIRFEQQFQSDLYELSAFRVEPADSRQVAVLFKNISDRRSAELDMEARVAAALSERRVLASVVEGTAAFVQVVDPDYRWLAINRAAADEFEKIFGARPRPGLSMLDILADKPEHRAAVEAVWRRALAGEAFTEVAEFGDPDLARRWYEMRFGVLRDDAGAVSGAYQFVYDVTDRLAEQERLRDAEEALRQAQKMEAVGQLTGGLAHDFNNLLAGISGAFEMIALRLAQGRPADVEKYLDAGLGATRRAAALTHRLLAFSRRQTLSPKPIVVNTLLPDLVELVRRTVGPGIAVATFGADDLQATMVDANQLENALLNLCINARDAMPHGGKLTIETTNVVVDAAAAGTLGMTPGAYVKVSVSDTGTGIDKDTLERVFDPFFTTKPLGAGTGLGLSMVYGFAKQSHGHVRIHSQVGSGTTVSIYLPKYLGVVATETPVDRVAPTPATQAATVLVIDDEPTVRMLVVDALSDLGYAVIEAGDGASGLALLERTPQVDLLITDVGLPGGLNGRQVADAARAHRPGLKVLFITGYAENAVLNHGHVEPGMEVVTKPFSVEDLAGRVERLLRA